MKRKLLLFFCALWLVLPSPAKAPDEEFQPLCDSLQVRLERRGGIRTKITLKRILKRSGKADYYFKENLGDYPFRSEDISWLRKQIKELAPSRYAAVPVGQVYAGRLKVEDLLCARYTRDGKPASTRLRRKKTSAKTEPLVWREHSEHFKQGLEGRHLAVWNSHGQYYNQLFQCWLWQRAPLFGTVEDVLTSGFVLDYLVPMLENAGAVVLLPRERDRSPLEYITDNDSSSVSRRSGTVSVQGKWEQRPKGFADPFEWYGGHDNPFVMGSCLGIAGTRKASANLTWAPDIPRVGSHAVYVCYQSLPESTSGAHYTVHHLGGNTSVRVNQKMGGGSWVYIGTYVMGPGSSVTLDNDVKDGGYVTGDAVRIGGGMGNIARECADTSLAFAPETVSGKARWAEGARYWLQWCGADSSVYSQNEGKHDYRDDFMSRGAWVKWLSGNERIPVDAALAFHTNAGAYQGDSTYGTLAIYTLMCEHSRQFSSGEDRLCQREYADFIQSQLVDDIRALFHPDWRRRELWDRSYSESRTTDVPTVLLELLSHQSFNDMKLALDPRFRFAVARSVYKGMLKFLSSRDGVPYQVQPLPVRDFAAQLDGDALRLSWNATPDPHEQTAKSEYFILYTRQDEGAFDEGKRIHPERDAHGRYRLRVPLEEGVCYDFRIAAANAGGISFPSETLSASRAADSKGTVLLVNNFTRLSGPAYHENESAAGFDYNKDSGVAYLEDGSYIGDMYETRRDLPWMDDHCPGFGASWQDFAGKVRGGNRLDYPARCGRDFRALGYSYCSCNVSALETFSEASYTLVDVICGKQTRMKDAFGTLRYEVFPHSLRSFLENQAAKGSTLLVSGSYVATDLWDPFFVDQADSSAQDFARKTLGWRWMTSRASVSGTVRAMHPRSGFNPAGIRLPFSFCTTYCDSLYRVDSPDGLVPASDGARTVFRYVDNNISAGVAYEGEGYRALTLGFPLEALEDRQVRLEIIKCALQ